MKSDASENKPRRGRPPQGDAALSGAERARRYRQRHVEAVRYAWVDAIGNDAVADSVVVDAIRDAIHKGDRDGVVELAGELIRRYS
ncbi:hypothetical protein ISN35_15330 [Xanthomonas translucens pv. undulosa]|uniref:hypothetical protein n=1 Tax=Xanthomonas campestris pv. translucens TaxID=343 RepID=UPI000AFF73A8|nr:hypothetical protein [Xanthomonas translucens]QSQ40417.1 hypothetical protein ISN33_12105 [Xanthomonas translucens pv. translucens]QSQ48386.1 hypothetical protein ISN35_15330 [Xanthomonas translucens pv. undulosa]